MINLLPVTEKQKIKKIYHMRVLSVCLALASILLVVSVIAFVPSYFTAVTKYEGIAAALDLSRNDSLPSRDDLKGIVKKANEKVSILQNTDASHPPVSDVFREIISAKGGVRLTGFSFGATAASPKGKKTEGAPSSEFHITVHGISKERDDLLAFIKALESNALFESVDFPISNFVKEKDLEFSINITLAPNRNP